MDINLGATIPDTETDQLEYIARGLGYQAILDDGDGPVPNPATHTEFVNERIKQFLLRSCQTGCDIALKEEQINSPPTLGSING